MPWLEGDKDTPSRYKMCFFSNVTDDDIDFLLQKRKEIISHREQLLVWQKECSELIKKPETKQVGISLARFFSDLASIELKYYRGVCYCLYRLMSQPPGDCTNNISKEISAYADYFFDLIVYRD